MQDYELSLQHVLWRVERLHQNKEVVTKRDEGIHRTTYGEMVPRINRLAGALKRIGVKPGDRVATLAERMAAAMCYTSGTTGNPQGVVYSHRSQFIHSMGVLQLDNLGLGSNDVLLPVVPMFHANSWGLPYAAGMAGSKVVFLGRFSADAKSIVELAEQEDATYLAGVPTIWIGLAGYLKETGKRLPKVRTVVCGGSAVPQALMETMDSLGLHILHAWGMTETSPLGSVPRVPADTKPEDELRLRLTQGRVTPGVEIRITDPTSGQELPWDGVAFGEIQVRGPWIARG